MKIRYIGEPGGRFNDQPLTSGDVLDLPDGVAQDLLGTSDFEKVETKQPKKKSKVSKKANLDESQIETKEQ
tara:strand:+ start:416 stop:628 length:213 start_codon:yes stop_codon:yes gene_type:complete